jgi:2-amino-4-hydroxy-6-hydroxymethyldihydropteridine diphosphokinase
MIYVALGANLPSQFGTPAETLAHAIYVLNDCGVRVVALSRVWLTAPVPISDQPWFHNAVARVETSLSPHELLSVLLSIESDFGRVRVVQNEARVLDLDIVAYNHQIIAEKGLVVPHPRMHERGFVLYPLQDIAPDWVHPQSQKSIDELISQLPADQMARVMENAA